jgi:phage shock protein E
MELVTAASRPSTVGSVRTWRRFGAVVLAALFLTAPLAACSSDEEAGADTPAQAVPQGTILLDVRTPEEYEAGHLPGAVNLNVQAADFEEQLLAGFDPAGDYYVYCRSGNRSGQAIARMREAGFTGELVNYGGLEEASSQLGLPIVR